VRCPLIRSPSVTLGPTAAKRGASARRGQHARSAGGGGSHSHPVCGTRRPRRNPHDVEPHPVEVVQALHVPRQPARAFVPNVQPLDHPS